MKQVVQDRRAGRISVLEVPPPALEPKTVRIHTVASLISAGTEKSSVEFSDRGLLGKAKARPDLARKVVDLARTEGVRSALETVRGRLSELGILGYSLAGTVDAVGREVEGLSPGDRVCAAGAKYANHAECVVVPGNLVARVPSTVTASDAAFTTVGAIALQGLRQANPLIGEIFLVIGLGLIGQITVQLLRANGCQVLAIDLRNDLIQRAEAFGAVGVAPGDLAAGHILAATGGRGVDGVIITASTPSSQPVDLAAAACREKGRIVIVGAVGMTFTREPLYMKEIEVRLSKSYGPGRYDPRYEEGGQDYPYGYVRFTEKRNMEAFVQLLADGRVDVASLITHRFTIADAPAAYDLIRGEKSEPYLGVLIDYPQGAPRRSTIPLAERRRSTGQLKVSFIGAGNYATARLLPRLKQDKRVDFQAVSTSSGLKARDVGDRFGFRLCTGDVAEVFGPETDIVFIATRHDSHARYVIEALRAGKHVFVEKPLCLTRDDLSAVAEAAATSSGHLLVGFNRRFAPLTRKIVDFMKADGAASSIHIRVNAGSVEPNHWTLDPNVGGGRILGEVCHFVDLAAVLSGSLPRRVLARAAAKPTASPLLCDDVAVTLTMDDGSIATILYAASGSRAMRKERAEILRAGRGAVLDDFVEAQLFGAREKRIRGGAQDKGQGQMLDTFLASVGTLSPAVPLGHLLTVSEATLAIVESLASGEEIELSQWAHEEPRV